MKLSAAELRSCTISSTTAGGPLGEAPTRNGPRVDARLPAACNAGDVHQSVFSPLGSYPGIAEFRTMLSQLKPKTVAMQGGQFTAWRWSGEESCGYIVGRKGEREYWFPRLEQESMLYSVTSRKDILQFGLCERYISQEI